jgi:hypothetical protein
MPLVWNNTYKHATLKIPVDNYVNIVLIEKILWKWKAIILGNKKEILLYENEFVIDNFTLNT